MIKSLFTLNVLVSFFSLTSVMNAQIPTSDYDKSIHNGWTLYLNKPTTEKQKPTLNKAYKTILTKLNEVEGLVPKHFLTEFKKVPVWISYNVADGACYHPSKQWLLNNKRNPEKAQCIEINNVVHFNRWIKHQPLMMLHELAHAYHHQVLKFKDKRITKAFKNANQHKLYQWVLTVHNRPKRAYALTNEKEYFSELTEAYFGTNDFYPFNRKDLEYYDPVGFKMIESVWK